MPGSAPGCWPPARRGGGVTALAGGSSARRCGRGGEAGRPASLCAAGAAGGVCCCVTSSCSPQHSSICCGPVTSPPLLPPLPAWADGGCCGGACSAPLAGISWQVPCCRRCRPLGRSRHTTGVATDWLLLGHCGGARGVAMAWSWRCGRRSGRVIRLRRLGPAGRERSAGSDVAAGEGSERRPRRLGRAGPKRAGRAR